MANTIDPVEGFIEFVNDVKPFHTKIIDVIIEYVYEDTMNVKIVEQLDWELGLDFSRYPGYCDDGYGLVEFGHLMTGDLSDNPTYDTNSPDYVSTLDRNSISYDPLAEDSATPNQLLVSKPYVTFTEDILESNWDNHNCPEPSEGLVFPTISECFFEDLNIVSFYCNDFHETFDALDAFTFSLHRNHIIQDSYTGTPTDIGVAKLYYHMDYGQWYWEIQATAISGNLSDYRIGVMEFDPLTVEPPFDLDTNKSPIGDLINQVGYAANGNIYKSGILLTAASSYSNGTTIGVGLDLVANTVTFYHSGVEEYVVTDAVDVSTLRGVFPTGNWVPPVDGCIFSSPPITPSTYNAYSPAVSTELSGGSEFTIIETLTTPSGFLPFEINCSTPPVAPTFAPFIFVVDPSFTGGELIIDAINAPNPIEIDWGDGTVESHDGASGAYHNYTSSGTGPFDVSITGNIYSIYFQGPS